MRLSLPILAVAAAWFDKQLAQRAVDTGPPVELFMGDGTFAEARVGARSEIATPPAWMAGSQHATLRPGADGSLSEGEAGTGSVRFQGDPAGHTDPQGTGAAEFVSAPYTRTSCSPAGPSSGSPRRSPPRACI
jgi:hypothetical protein